MRLAKFSEGPVTKDDQITADILRVDHAGEYGAIRIYAAQRSLARWRAPDLLPFLDHTLADERQHRIEFERLMRERGVGHCRALRLWGLGGSLLGFMTGAFGRSAILICTEAVERTVHRHLGDQILWLSERHAEIARTLVSIQAEELEHLHSAKAKAPGRRTPPMRILDQLIAAATEALIWLSTYGGSVRAARQIKA